MGWVGVQGMRRADDRDKVRLQSPTGCGRWTRLATAGQGQRWAVKASVGWTSVDKAGEGGERPVKVGQGRSRGDKASDGAQGQRPGSPASAAGPRPGLTAAPPPAALRRPASAAAAARARVPASLWCSQARRHEPRSIDGRGRACGASSCACARSARREQRPWRRGGAVVHLDSGWARWVRDPACSQRVGP
jgi:hypothetical protein